MKLDITHPEETETHPELTASEATNRLGISMILINYSQPLSTYTLSNNIFLIPQQKSKRCMFFRVFFLHEGLKVYTLSQSHFPTRQKSLQEDENLWLYRLNPETFVTVVLAVTEVSQGGHDLLLNQGEVCVEKPLLVGKHTNSLIKTNNMPWETFFSWCFLKDYI